MSVFGFVRELHVYLDSAELFGNKINRDFMSHTRAILYVTVLCPLTGVGVGTQVFSRGLLLWPIWLYFYLNFQWASGKREHRILVRSVCADFQVLQRFITG